MEKIQKYQFLKLVLIAFLLVSAPLVPLSLRSSYIYFLLNLLIVILGAESGLFKVLSKPMEEMKLVSVLDSVDENGESKKEVIRSSTEKKMTSLMIRKLKKCPSSPSLFFLGSPKIEEEMTVHEEDFEEMSAQELFAKAENFIGNFYKQLKMQREESWSKIHGFYHKVF